MNIPIPGLCPVCSRPKNPSLPLFMRCQCRGIIMGDKLIPIPKGPITIGPKGVKSMKRKAWLQKDRQRWLDKQKEKE